MISLQRLGSLLGDDPSLVDVTTIHHWLSDESYWATGRSPDPVRRSIERSRCLGVYGAGGQAAVTRRHRRGHGRVDLRRRRRVPARPGHRHVDGARRRRLVPDGGRSPHPARYERRARGLLEGRVARTGRAASLEGDRPAVRVMCRRSRGRSGPEAARRARCRDRARSGPVARRTKVPKGKSSIAPLIKVGPNCLNSRCQVVSSSSGVVQ